MSVAEQLSAWRGILGQLCPRCREGKIFRRSIVLFPHMNEFCPVCGLKFEREQGYFLGAMYISYGIALVVITAFSLLLYRLADWSFEKTVLWAVVLFLPFAPAITFLSRVVWIYLDRAIDPGEQNS